MPETGKFPWKGWCEAYGHVWGVDKLSPNYSVCLHCGKQVREIPKGVKNGNT